MRLPEHHTPATIKTPRVMRVLANGSQIAANDEPDGTERDEVTRGFAIAAGRDPFAEDDRAKQAELLRARGYL